MYESVLDNNTTHLRREKVRRVFTVRDRDERECDTLALGCFRDLTLTLSFNLDRFGTKEHSLTSAVDRDLNRIY